MRLFDAFRSCFALALVLLVATSVRAQEFERFGIREGLPSELINDVALGPDGLLWIGTDGGLARYDGHGFTVWQHHPDDPTTLPSSRISAVVPVTGRVWVGTAEGLAYLDLQTGASRRVTAMPTAHIDDIVVDPGGTLWVGYRGEGLWRFHPAEGEAEFVPFERDGVAYRGRIISLATHDGGVWAAMGSAPDRAPTVCRVHPARLACDDARPGDHWRLLEDAGQAVLVHTSPATGASHLTWLATGERWALAPSVSVKITFRSILRTAPDMAWLRTGGGMIALHRDGRASMVPVAPERRGGLGGYDAHAFALDRQGNMWVGTEAGLYFARFAMPTFTSIQHEPGDPATLSDDRINGLAQDATGTVWVTTNNGLNRLDLETGRVERQDATAPWADGRMYRAFWQVSPGPDGVLWLGLKYGGLAVWDGVELRPVPSDMGPIAAVRSLLHDGDGGLWSGLSGSLWHRDSEGTEARVLLAGRLSRSGNEVYRDRHGGVWVGTDTGLFRRADDGVWVPVAEHDLCAPIVWSMAESASDPGALWVGTVGGGLARLDLDTHEVECLTDRDGLPTNSVYGVLADDYGALWVSTPSGLARVDIETRRARTFSSADGLAGDAFNLMAQLRLADGRLAFGGQGGLTLVDPSQVVQRPAPEVVITGVERQGRLLPGTPARTIQLRHDGSAFGVRFAATDFRAPRSNRYRYRLVGLDSDWRTTDGAAPRAAYAGVPPGRYRFEVLAAAADTPFSGVPATLVVEVVPALWQRRAFQLGMALLGLALVGGVGWAVQRRRRQHQERARAEAVEIRRRLAEARERERVRLARDLHDGPVQTLYRVGHDLDRLSSTASRDGGAVAVLDEAVAPIRDRVGDVSDELRQMLVELRPTLADHLGLGAALRAIARRAEERFPHLDIAVLDEARAPATPAGRLALFRIAQEALQNAGRHAGPARVALRLHTAEADEREWVRLTVQDNGRGFVVPERMVELARTEHFGLVGAQERAEAAGGGCCVTSAPGAGTKVEVWVPVGAQENR
ncbi:MAG: two-component regulator propeller domain-containing protein [Bacteroidota bacterium]